MRRYAQDTSVSVEKSRAEIEGLLRKYSAATFMSGQSSTEAVIAFEMHDRKILFRLPLPSPNEDRFRLYKRGYNTYKRTDQVAMQMWEQACRSRWRALALAIKAELEAVAIGITTFEDEFLAHIIMPDGLSVGDHVRPKIADAYASGKVTPLLPAPGGI